MQSVKKVFVVCDDLFGLEIYSLIRQINDWHIKKDEAPEYEVVGFLSMSAEPFGDIHSPLPMAVFPDMPDFTVGASAVMGISLPQRKKEAVVALKSRGVCFDTVFAPWMLAFREWLTVGEGSVVCAYSTKSDFVIGDFVTLDASMMSGHSIGDYSTVMRFSNIAGESIGKNSYVGNHVFLAVGRSIGDDCIVDDGSIVVKNAKSGSHVSGVPARRK